MKFSSAAGAVCVSVEKLVACDVALLSADDGAHQLRRLTCARNQIDAVCAELASDAVRGDVQNGASWVAGTTGVTKRDAKKMLETQAKLEKLPAVANAAKLGEISTSKAEAIAKGADGDEATANALLSGATEKTVEELEEEARRLARKKAGSEQANHARLRKLRSCATWTDKDGLTALLVKDTPEMMAPYLDDIRRAEKGLSRDRGATPAARRCDAFHAAFARRGDSDKRSNVFVHVDHGALLRGYAKDGETSEVAGLGAIPVKLVQEMINDCVLHVVINKHNRLIWFGTKDQLLPERIKQAVRAKFKHQCAHCGEYGNQVDHIVARINGGSNDVDNLQCLCDRCHASKTTRDAPWTSEKYYGKWRDTS